MWHSCCPFVVRGEILQTNRQGPNFQLHVSTDDRPGRVFCTITPAILCYAVGIYTGPGVPCRYLGFVPISGLLHAVGTGLEYPAGIRFAAKTRRDSFTPSVPALEYPAGARFCAKTRRCSVSLEYPAGARFCAKTRR